MADARSADFLGGSGVPLAKPKIYAPGEEPNPKNPGGISDNELKRRKKAAEIKELEKQHAEDLKRAQKEIGKKIVAEREAYARTQPGFWGRAASDLKVLGPAVLKVAGTAAAVVATGGAAAGAIGLGAGLAGVTAAAVTADKVIGAVNTGQKVVSSLKKGDVAGLAGAAKDGLAQAGVKTPPLPSPGKLGKEVVANLPKISEAKKELAAASSTVKAAIAAPKAAVKTVTAAAAKVAPPKAAPAKVIASAANIFKPAAAAATAAAKPTGKKLEDQLSAFDKARLKLPGAKIVVMKNGTVTVSVPASGTAATALFAPLAAGAKPLAAVLAPAAVVRPTTPASASVTIKPASSKPPAMTINVPPSPSPSVGSTIATATPASAPPVIKPPPAVASDAPSSGPTLEGYLVKLNGTIEPRGRYRAA